MVRVSRGPLSAVVGHADLKRSRFGPKGPLAEARVCGASRSTDRAVDVVEESVREEEEEEEEDEEE